MLPAFPVIVGPTAGGKSALAVALARALQHATGLPGHVVTADSMQVYRGMDIGTAKPTAAEQAGVAHHLIDLVEPTQPFTVEQWLRLADGTIADVRQQGGVPIVVGGTHFYVKAFLEGLFEGPGSDQALRAELHAMPDEQRWAELVRVDPASAARLHRNDARRVVRALEVYRLTGEPISAHQSQWDQGQRRPDAFLVGLDWPTEAINRRINARVRAMVEQGLVEEVRSLWSAGLLPRGSQAREALGYKQLIACFEIEKSGRRPDLDDAIERIKIETRRFAKNQRTWLRRLRASAPPAGSPAAAVGDVWASAADTDTATIAQVVLSKWLPAIGLLPPGANASG
jgi:tRNA dimethylallyltransferase